MPFLGSEGVPTGWSDEEWEAFLASPFFSINHKRRMAGVPEIVTEPQPDDWYTNENGETFEWGFDIDQNRYRWFQIDISIVGLPSGRKIEPPTKGKSFLQELTELINRHSLEGTSNTPDFILASFLQNVLTDWNHAVNARDKWYGRPPTITAS